MDEDEEEEEFMGRIMKEFKAATVRRLIKDMKDADGWPLMGKMIIKDPVTGKPALLYKPEEIFDAEDYSKVISYHADQARKHLERAEGYRRRAKARFGVEIPDSPASK